MFFKEILLDFNWRNGVSHVTNPMLILTTLCYFVSAFICHQAGKIPVQRNSNPKIDQRVSRFWKTVTVLLIVFGITELLDIQLFLTHVARQISKACGWYQQRAPVQKQIIWSSIILAMGAFIYISVLLRRILWKKVPALFGIAFLCGFIAVRAVSYHHVDSFLNDNVAGIQLNWLFELIALLFISISAIFSLGQSRYRQTIGDP